jgi:hypothetical protein
VRLGWMGVASPSHEFWPTRTIRTDIETNGSAQSQIESDRAQPRLAVRSIEQSRVNSLLWSAKGRQAINQPTCGSIGWSGIWSDSFAGSACFSQSR